MTFRADGRARTATRMAVHLAAFATGIQAAGASSGVIGWIEIQPTDNASIAVVGHALALKATKGKFTLSLNRKSKGNAAKTGQTGTFDAASGESVILSKTTINVSGDDEFEIELRLSVDGKDVYQTILRSNVNNAVSK